jgi:hypothetical protein
MFVPYSSIPLNPFDILPCGALANLDIYRSSFHSHTSVPPPNPTLPLLEDDSIASELPSIHGDAL